MTKKQIVSLVATKAHMTRKAAREAIDTFLNEISKALNKREKVVLSGFGTFKVTKVKDKPVIVPGSKEKKLVKAHYAPRFSPGKPLKKTIK
jgi:nucleoid DNA-binding protein